MSKINEKLLLHLNHSKKQDYSLARFRQVFTCSRTIKNEQSVSVWTGVRFRTCIQSHEMNLYVLVLYYARRVKKSVKNERKERTRGRLSGKVGKDQGRESAQRWFLMARSVLTKTFQFPYGCFCTKGNKCVILEGRKRAKHLSLSSDRNGFGTSLLLSSPSKTTQHPLCRFDEEPGRPHRPSAIPETALHALT